MHNRPVFLIGFMGSGKSTLGKRLARLLHWSFIDLDHYLENQEKQSISQLFQTHGETGFRHLEQQALSHVMGKEDVIIATGGGTPCFFDNMTLMNKAGITIYLSLSPEILVERLLPGQQHRPLIADKKPEELLPFISRKLNERIPFYRQAQIITDADKLSEEAYVRILKNAGVKDIR